MSEQDTGGPELSYGLYLQKINPSGGTITRNFPLYISGTGWHVGFMTHPERKVVVTGRAPTVGEMFDSLAAIGPITQATLLAIAEALVIAAEVAREGRA